MIEFEMVPTPNVGRSFEVQDRVRLSDVSPGGGLRLDAVVRYSQIVSNDDTNDSGLEDDLAWIARSTVVDVHSPARVDEPLTIATFCGGLGRTWAERRVSMHGEWGGHYELATLWVSIEPEAMRPRRLSEQFLELYGPSTQGRKVSARQKISRPSAELISAGERLQWTPRWGDFDAFGHLNNVIYWTALEHALGDDVKPGTRLLIEHGAGVQPDEASDWLVERSDGGLRMWWLPIADDGTVSNQYLAAAQISVS